MGETAPTSWEQTAQSWGTMLLDRYTAATYVPPSQQPMVLQAKTATGRAYIEGQPNAIAGLKVSPMLLLGGAAVLAVVLLMRKG